VSSAFARKDEDTLVSRPNKPTEWRGPDPIQGSLQMKPSRRDGMGQYRQSRVLLEKEGNVAPNM